MSLGLFMLDHLSYRLFVTTQKNYSGGLCTNVVTGTNLSMVNEVPRGTRVNQGFFNLTRLEPFFNMFSNGRPSLNVI